jgi:acyl dehydratase
MTTLDPQEFLARGKVFPEFPLDLSSERIAAYRSATRDAATPENLAPPAAILALSLEPLLADLTLLKGAIHTGQELRMHRVVAIGERLTARVTVANSSLRGGALFAAIDQTVVDESNQVVLDGRSNVIVALDEGR